MEWAFLATAPDQTTAEMWVEALTEAGIAAMIVPSDQASYLGVAGFGTRVQVRRSDIGLAREILGLDEGEDD
jgi:hypothetical protein